MGILGARKKSTDYLGINSIIGDDTQIKGEIITKGSIRMGGEFEEKFRRMATYSSAKAAMSRGP